MNMLRTALGAAALLCLPALPAHAQTSATHAQSEPSGALPGQDPAAPSAPARARFVAPPVELPSGKLLLDRDTMVRLMVTKEVNSRTAQPGDRFQLRVDEPVTVAGRIVIPVGARATGEVTSAEGTSGLGKAGRLAAKLLYLEIGDERIPLTGEQQTKGARSTDRVVMTALTFGVLGLFTKGNNAKLKAGDIINGYVAEPIAFDPSSGTFGNARSDIGPLSGDTLPASTAPQP